MGGCLFMLEERKECGREWGMGVGPERCLPFPLWQRPLVVRGLAQN